MPFFQFSDIKVTGIASAVPTEVVRVESFAPVYGEEAVKQFTAMTGVTQFRRTKKYQTASDLGFAAAEKLFADKKVDRARIGALVFASHLTDYRRPATACVLHKRLGLSKECAAFDLGLGCSASVYGIQTVCSMMASSDIDMALLVVGETLSKLTNPRDKSVSMLFGDAGSALLFERVGGSGISALLRSNGEGYRAIIVPAGGFSNPDAPREESVWPDGNTRTLYDAYMNGADVFNFTIKDVPQAIRDFFAKTGTSVGDYDCFAMHQANRFIHKQLSKKLSIPMEKMPVCLDRYGNTSAPAIPLTLCDAYGSARDETVKALLCGFGVGLSWGVVSLTLDTNDIYGITETDDWFEEGFINEPF